MALTRMFGHLRSEDARTQECARKTDGDIGIPDIEREVFQAGPLLALRIGFDFWVVGRVVDEDVYVAKLVEDGVLYLQQRLLRGDIRRKAEAVDPVRVLKLLGAQPGAGAGQVEQDNMGAARGENSAVVKAEHAGSAGHNGYAAGQIEKRLNADRIT